MEYTIAGEIVIYKDGKRHISFDCPKKKPVPLSEEDLASIVRWAMGEPKGE